MDTLLQRLAQHGPALLFALSVSNALTLLIVVFLWKRVRTMAGRWRVLLEGARGDTLERLLLDHLKDRMTLREDLVRLESRVSDIEEKAGSAKRYLGLVRYDAFDDLAGAQSFALALFDDHGDGAVLTSVVGRSDCRVFCKPLLGGRSERHLSREEQRAIEEATRGGARSVLS